MGIRARLTTQQITSTAHCSGRSAKVSLECQQEEERHANNNKQLKLINNMSPRVMCSAPSSQLASNRFNPSTLHAFASVRSYKPQETQHERSLSQHGYESEPCC